MPCFRQRLAGAVRALLAGAGGDALFAVEFQGGLAFFCLHAGAGGRGPSVCTLGLGPCA